MLVHNKVFIVLFEIGVQLIPHLYPIGIRRFEYFFTKSELKLMIVAFRNFTITIDDADKMVIVARKPLAVLYIAIPLTKRKKNDTYMSLS